MVTCRMGWMNTRLCQAMDMVWVVGLLTVLLTACKPPVSPPAATTSGAVGPETQPAVLRGESGTQPGEIWVGEKPELTCVVRLGHSDAENKTCLYFYIVNTGPHTVVADKVMTYTITFGDPMIVGNDYFGHTGHLMPNPKVGNSEYVGLPPARIVKARLYAKPLMDLSCFTPLYGYYELTKENLENWNDGAVTVKASVSVLASDEKHRVEPMSVEAKGEVEIVGKIVERWKK